MDNKDKDCDQLLASVANYFLQTEYDEISRLLAQSNLTYWEREAEYWDDDAGKMIPFVAKAGYVLNVPPTMYQNIINPDPWYVETLEEIFSGVGVTNIAYSLHREEYDINWRMRLVAESDTAEVSNQGNFTGDKHVYLGMKFGSPPEIEIAKVLEQKGIMYFPNAMVRAGTKENRKTRFPDFLIHHMGKWGILEVDGQTYHTRQNSTKDHERTQLLQMHGKLYVARYEAMKCLNTPDEIVSNFLLLLAKNG